MYTGSRYCQIFCRRKLLCVPIKPRDVYTYDDRPAERIEAVAEANVDGWGVSMPSFFARSSTDGGSGTSSWVSHG